MQFNPLAAARQIITETNLTDPDEVAEEVYRRTPDDALTAAYRLILRNTAREAIRTNNMAASVPPRTMPNRSGKVAAIKASHTGYFDQRVFANGDWKLLRHCTRADVLDLAQQRQEIADRNLAKVAEFTALAEQMKQSGAQYAGDLEKEQAA